MPGVDLTHIAGYLFSVDGHAHPVAQVEGAEDRENEAMYDIRQAFLENKAEDHDDERRREEDLAGKILEPSGLGF